MWDKLSVKLLRDIATKYKALHSLGNISKQKKSVLLETLKKVMEFRGNVLFTKAEHGNKKVASVEEDEPKAKEPTPKAKKPTPKAKEPTPKAKKPTPKAKEPTPKLQETNMLFGNNYIDEDFYYSGTSLNAYKVIVRRGNFEKDRVLLVGKYARGRIVDELDEPKDVPSNMVFYTTSADGKPSEYLMPASVLNEYLKDDPFRQSEYEEQAKLDTKKAEEEQAKTKARLKKKGYL